MRENASLHYSDDAGSDSSMDDGLPKHLEAIAAAGRMRRKKPTKKKASSNVGKDEADKENNEKVGTSRVWSHSFI